MNVSMAGLDFHAVSLAEREPASFVAGQVERLLPKIRAFAGVRGCVLLSTCNRTELYLHTEGECDPAAVLCGAAGLGRYERLAVKRYGEDAARHLFAVAAGLESQIFGDGQIVTQVGAAIALARQAGSADSVLDSLFRRAVAAGKRVRTETRLTAVPASAAHSGVRLAGERLGGLAGKRAVVIGNGEMGRLTARLLREAGCAVTVTLRSYRHGETVVPAGCATHPYDDRYTALAGADLAVSATTSPHFTLTADRFAAVSDPPRLLVDLAIPRDIDAAIGEITGVTVCNLDDLGRLADENAGERARAESILAEEFEEFRRWYAYREALPEIAALKDETLDRLRHDRAFDGLAAEGDTEGMAALAVGKTIDLLLGGMKEIVTPERLETCLSRVKKGSRK